jgi:hypothetical protein
VLIFFSKWLGYFDVDKQIILPIVSLFPMAFQQDWCAIRTTANAAHVKHRHNRGQDVWLMASTGDIPHYFFKLKDHP